MDPRLLQYYSRELQHIRETSAEFAQEYPKIAGRLGLDGMECADPYVERLLEGFSYLAARVQLKVDAEYPRFTQNLLESVYPHYLAPLPSMAMVQFKPNLKEGALAEGFTVPRGTALRSQMSKDAQTPCEYRTARDVTLWPIEIKSAEYLATSTAVAALGFREVRGANAAIRFRLKAAAGLTFDKLAIDRLPIFLHGGDKLPSLVYEELIANAIACIVQPANGSEAARKVVSKSHIKPLGFAKDEALLPYGPQSFEGYRYLQEYFAFPERFLMVELGGLVHALQQCSEDELDIFVLLKASNSDLRDVLDASNFALFCSPAINLFEKRTDRIHLTNKVSEHHIVPDRSRPLDFEVHSVTSVLGFGAGSEQRQEFQPLYSANDLRDYREDRAYYTLHREPRVLSSRQQRFGLRSSYVGSEVFLSLVDANEAPYSTELRQLSLITLCTNRDLPLQMPVGQGTTDFTLGSGAPIISARCLAGPTRPRSSPAQRDIAWQLISHLSLNYLSLINNSAEYGAAALRQLLALYGNAGDPSVQKQIEGLVSVNSRPVNRRIAGSGPIAFGRGLEVTLTMDERAFEGTGVFLLGSVLDRFLAKYVSINSFTETALTTTERGEVMRWPVRIGRRHVL